MKAKRLYVNSGQRSFDARAIRFQGARLQKQRYSLQKITTSTICEESGFTKSECRAQSCCRWTAAKTCVWIDYEWSECRTGTRLDVTAADARGADAFSTLLLVGALLVIAGFIVGRKATRAAESRPLLATTA